MSAIARTDQHAAYAFLSYYIIWLIFFANGEFILPRWLAFFVIICGIFPDFDAVYFIVKHRGEVKIDNKFQHHLFYWTHWPLSYTPLVILAIISIIFNFYPEYFLMPVIGIYCGHFLFDSISCGDGIMWGKIPWKKNRYARFINLAKGNADGYHGHYWEARYKQTLIYKIGNIVVLISIILLIIFQILTSIDHFQAGNPPGISGYYIVPIIFLIWSFYLGNKKTPEKYLQEPPEGRYADYRTNPNYINGLSKKNQKRHIEKYKALLEKRGILNQIKLKFI